MISIDEFTISTDHYIGGKRFSSAKTFTDISPIDGRVLGEVSAGGQQEADLAVAAAKESFPAWAALGSEGRLPYLEKLAHIIEENVDALAKVETTDNGSLYEASLLRVMKRGGHNIHWFAEYAVNQLREHEVIWETPHRNACLFASMAYAMWDADPEKFYEFDRWMIETGSASVPPDAEAARAKAEQLLGAEALAAALADPRLDEKIETASRIWNVLKTKTGQPAMPKMVWSNGSLTEGSTGNEFELFGMMEEKLRLKRVN